jgi:hypothetical protein
MVPHYVAYGRDKKRLAMNIELTARDRLNERHTRAVNALVAQLQPEHTVRIAASWLKEPVYPNRERVLTAYSSFSLKQVSVAPGLAAQVSGTITTDEHVEATLSAFGVVELPALNDRIDVYRTKLRWEMRGRYLPLSGDTGYGRWELEWHEVS